VHLPTTVCHGMLVMAWVEAIWNWVFCLANLGSIGLFVLTPFYQHS
jgi:hypothetical protein